MSSVVPSDSVSTSGAGGKNKSRPGKKERAMRKGLSTASSQTAPTSMSNAQAFAAGVVSAPAPQPGKYPVVFPSGAGEPTRDSFFSFSGPSLGAVTSDLAGRYVGNSKWAEFAANAEIEAQDFETLLVQGFYLGLAQQTVHAHMNMGLPQGDFSPVASSEIWNPAAVRSILSQFGEFPVESLGTRYLLAGYESSVKAAVRAAKRVKTDTVSRVAETFWLPTSGSDNRSKHIVACSLSSFVKPFGVQLDVDELATHVFKDSSEAWNGVKTILGDDDVKRDRFDFLFGCYTTEAEYVSGLTASTERVAALKALGLEWPTPSVGDLCFSLLPKVEFSPLADGLARYKATFAKFFSIGTGLTNRSAACGSPGQMSSVEDRSGVVVVKSRLAVSAPEYSLLACFPFSGLFSDPSPQNVVLTTSLNVAQRATEFAQLDWLCVNHFPSFQDDVKLWCEYLRISR
ncbi:coat protein 1 [Alternaria tenuissima partitivirus 1]|nr:coat protein 1 [Alternaria tenuissima partitivirus 1]